jgi:glycosyltransferase involved in cell wall biosynthesis
VFFQTSRWEAMSIAILEAMASGRAIVATKVGDNPHVIEDGVSGLLVDSGDTAAMTDALARVADRGLREKLGTAALARFEAKFTLEQMIGCYEGIYRELVGQ